MPIIDQFQSDPNVFIFLISTLAGGVGLNLTSANKVVVFGGCRMLTIFSFAPCSRYAAGILKILTGVSLSISEISFNLLIEAGSDPAHDLQAMDRAYRFGQTRDVAVYRLLGAGSIEELIYARQVYKQQQMAIGYEASVQTRYFYLCIVGDR